MKIQEIGLALPEKVVNNEDIVDMIRIYSKDIFIGDIDNLSSVILKLLGKCGSITRHWSFDKYKPLEYIGQAFDQAFDSSGLSKADIGLVIYVGVDRGFFEPANAYFLSDYLGLKSAQCFDLNDACNGWSRALHICDALFRAEEHSNALILSGEFPMHKGGAIFPELYQIQSLRQLEHRFPAFTLGEGATATIITAEKDSNWEYKSVSSPTYANLCTISCSEQLRFSRESELLNRDGSGYFVSHGEAMINYGMDDAIRAFRSLSAHSKSIRAVFPHLVSQPSIEAAADKIGMGELIYSVFPKVGNLVSSSIPAGISLAKNSERLQKGDVAAGWVASAGMVFSAYTFTV